MKKYEFTGETIIIGERTLRRIRAVCDFGDVKAGDIGGWIEKEENLSHEGECWVRDNAKVCDTAIVGGSAEVSDVAEDETCEQMDKAVAEYKIEKLQAEIRRLSGED